MDLMVVVETKDTEEGPRKYLADLQNPFEKYDSEEFHQRFAFSKDACQDLFEIIRDDAELIVRAHSVPPMIQLLTTLQYLVTGVFHKNNGCCMMMSRVTAGAVIKRIATCVARRRSNFIQFPNSSQRKRFMQGFYKIAAFPSVVGVLGCTYIPIMQLPWEKRDEFLNENKVASINVQAICAPDKTFTNIVARWPGSVSDSDIFEKSAIRRDFQSGKISGYLVGGAKYVASAYLMTPVNDPSTLAEEVYNRSHETTLACITQALSEMKKRFHIFETPMRTKLDTSLVVIVAVACLHNFAIKNDFQATFENDDEDLKDYYPINQPPVDRQQLIETYFKIDDDNL